MSQPTVIGYIKEQPKQLAYVFENREEFIQPFLDVFEKNQIQKVIFFGSGTSYNVSIIAAYYFKHIVGLNAEAQYPTVFKNYEQADWTNSLDKKQILFVGVSQSGTSISTVEVMRYAQKMGYPTLAITGNDKSIIAQYADVVTPLLVGDELTPPETKGYTVSLLSVYLWALECAKQRDKMCDADYKKAIHETKELIEHFQLVIDESEAWYDRNKSTILNSDRIYTLGYGIDYGTVLEAQLKIGEMLRLPSLGYEIEEYSHGPTMALNSKQTIFIIGSDEKEFEHMLKFCEAFRRYSDRVHIITCRDLKADVRNLNFSYRANKYLAPVMYTVPFQFVAAKGAKDIGIDTSINPFDIPLAHYEK